MLLASEVGDDSKLADEMCGATDYDGIKKEHLSADQVRTLLDKLLLTKESISTTPSGCSRGSVLCIPNCFSSSSCGAWILTPSSIGEMNRKLATLRFPFTASETPFALCRKAPVTKSS